MCYVVAVMVLIIGTFDVFMCEGEKRNICIMGGRVLGSVNY